ncbi:MFS general substrate transporter-13 [Coleophoma crateriformis]|uniref:MFS general substrate transporter-13 n=1 Tax=Coleophoma crateriformis TaxID=565419 RepID=A0A3D8QLT0_9HELO|nr:MFS general substrate transporter-13 [Coleophoma crateriformis]
MFGSKTGTRYFGLRGQKLNNAVGIIAGLDFFLFGYDQGVMGGLLTLGSFVDTFPEINTTKYTLSNGYPASVVNHVSTIQGISVASYNVGCFIGAVLTIFIGDILGRRKMIFLGSTIMVIGAALQCSAFSLGHFIAGRVITGFGNGMNTSTVPTWASETSKSHKRGKMVMIEGAMITGGIAFSYWLDFGFSFAEPSSISWRFPIGFQIFFALILVALILELPESPRWLILKGKEDEALSVLSALNDMPPDDHIIQSEFAEIKDTVLEMKAFGYRDLFTMGPDRNFHRVVLAYVNQVFQQISGINLITYYAATIYQTYIGLGPLTSRLLAAANGTEYFLASWIAVYTIEKFGRRSLMLFGAVGMSGSMAILAGTNYASSLNIGGSAPGIVSATFLFVFNTFFAIGWLGMTWLYPAEIVPLRIRAPANGLSTSANWAFNFMVVMITPVSFTSIGYKTYIIFAVINAFIVPVVYFFYPETAYRSLEEVDTIFRKTKGWFNVVSTARNEPNRYGKHGELLIDYVETEEHAFRRQSVASHGVKPTSGNVEHAENGSHEGSTYEPKQEV